MKIAVTYENGEIFQHFGRIEQFRVYDPDNQCDHHDHDHEACGHGGCHHGEA